MELVRGYQCLYQERIFFGGRADVAAMVGNGGCRIIVDLRAEASEPSIVQSDVTYIHVPIAAGAEGQEELLKRAIYTIIEVSQEGTKIGFHSEDGCSRAGSVAAGIRVALGLAVSVEDAEEQVKAIRPETRLHPHLKNSLLLLQSDRKTFIYEPEQTLPKTYTSVSDIIRERRTVWDFKADVIPLEQITELLNVAVWAPTHGLREPWRFTLIRGDARRRFAEAVVETYSEEDKVKYGQRSTDYYLGIPYHLMVTIPQDTRQNKYDEDFAATSCMILNLQLAAWEQGIGLVWKTNPFIYAPSFRETYNVQPSEKIVGVLHIGYPAKIYKPRRRTQAEEKLTILSTYNEVTS